MFSLSIFSGITDAIGDFFGGIGDTIKGAFQYVADKILEGLSNLVGTILYAVVKVLCFIVKILYSFFGIFSGINKVSYDGSESYLINVFFGNKSINAIYWGIALISIALTFGFTIFAVIRKTLDIEGKVSKSFGSILLSAGKSILLILLMSAIVVSALSMCNLLLAKVSDIFMQGEVLFMEDELVFTDEQFAAMGRIMNTVGNYSLNDSYDSRFNLNSCYNDIRGDLLLLQEQNVFKYQYSEKDGPSWQSMLARIVEERNPEMEVMLDDRNTCNSILELMYVLRTNKAFYPVQSVKLDTIALDQNQDVPLDRVIFLLGTMEAAKNSAYNVEPSLNDAVRGPFYNGTKDIYELSDVKGSFNIGVTGISYILIAIVAWMTMKNLTICLFNAIARIYNLLGLYLTAPAFLAVQPLDDGAKFKQWMTASIVQLFGIFGNVIPMLLVIKFIPIIFDSKLVMMDNGFFNLLAKGFILVASFEASNKFTDLFNGILAGNAGMVSGRASDMSGMAGRFRAGAAGFVGGATGASYVGKKVGDAAKYIGEHGGILGSPFAKHFDNKNKATEKSKQANLQAGATAAQDIRTMLKAKFDEKK